jgi:acyl carrier protein
VDWARLKGAYEARRARPFLSLVGSSRIRGEARDRAEAALAIRLAATPGDERRDVVIDYLRAEVARALGMGSAEHVDTDHGLFEMGMDSLMSLELKSRIEAAMGRDLPSTLTFNYPTISTLADFLVADPVGGGAPAPNAAPPPSATVDEDMTEDEVAALLSARLAKLQAASDARP